LPSDLLAPAIAGGKVDQSPGWEAMCAAVVEVLERARAFATFLSRRE